MLQRLSIALEQAKAGNTSEKLLNEIHQIIYYLHWAKEITTKLYKNIMNWIKAYYIIDTIYIRILQTVKHLTLTDYQEVINMLLYQIVASTLHEKT